MSAVLNKRDLAKGITEITVDAPVIAQKAKAGHLVPVPRVAAIFTTLSYS